MPRFTLRVRERSLGSFDVQRQSDDLCAFHVSNTMTNAEQWKDLTSGPPSLQAAIPMEEQMSKDLVGREGWTNLRHTPWAVD